MKIYIAGKISGEKDYKLKFGEAEILLSAKGHSVMNPAWLCGYPEFTYEDYIDISDYMRKKCDAIYFLNNWKESNGAERERFNGTIENQKLFYSIDDVPAMDK